MTTLILKIYDYMHTHKSLCAISFVLITIVLVMKVTGMTYKEDISDFLPVGSKHQDALKVYQDISGANKIFAIFQYRDTALSNPDVIVETINAFAGDLAERDSSGMIKDLTAQVDIEKISTILDFIYCNIPYFLEEKDYARMDSLLSDRNYIEHQIQQDKQMLMFPAGGLLSDNIQRDPLNLFTPAVAELQRFSGINYEMYDGYIFSPDMKRAIVMMTSPFGASETENNSRLVNLLHTSAAKTERIHTDIEIHITGGPAIAVGNAEQIKKDSILSVGLATTLIMILLFLSFRSFKNLSLIAMSIAWGWLFAIGWLAFVHDNVSVIVIGISSVILGIAVNYPLHFIAHLSHTPDIRSALKEIIKPLIVGNITTVGAFICLVPLQSVALRDLGLFSSFLLIGTIIFVILYLPHVTKVGQSAERSIFSKLSDVSLENKPWLIVMVIILTLVFGYFSSKTEFDANIGHINYMTDGQKADMAYFQEMMPSASSNHDIYVVSSDTSLEAATDKSRCIQPFLDRLKTSDEIKSVSGCSQFLPSSKEQALRLERWKNFTAHHAATIETGIKSAARNEGFSEDSFNEFLDILNADYKLQNLSYFNMIEGLFASNLSIDSINGKFNIIDIVTADKDAVDAIKTNVQESHGSDYYCFDVESMNSAIANNLSSDFNYIGWACGLIVFFFLWFSLGNIELALLSFLPMAVSWIWILGIMALLGIKFNIVNVILATFIFGQGDDYTIFMTEGSCYEYAYRKKMLASYKNSIIISALIMFIGIGTLIVAKHPALHSLAEVTIIGMFSVVLMAYLFPPLIFKWLVSHNNRYRIRPVYIRSFASILISGIVFFLQLASVYIIGCFLFDITKTTEHKKRWFHKYIQRLFLFDMSHLPYVKFRIANPHSETFDKPALIISNHQSMMDSACFMALTPKAIIIANENASMNRVIRKVFRQLDFYTLEENMPLNLKKLQTYKENGYSIVIFPEGERNPNSSVLRFHKGAFYIAEQLKLDIVPVILHGVNDVLPRNSVASYPGFITVSIGKRFEFGRNEFGDNDYRAITKFFNAYYKEQYAIIAGKIENSHYYRQFIIDRYRYKGSETISTIKKNLNKYDCYTEWIDKKIIHKNIMVINNDVGDFSLLMAMVHPHINIYTYEKDEDKRNLAKYSAELVANNIHELESPADMNTLMEKDDMQVYLLFPDKKEEELFSKYNPLIIG